MFLKGEDLGKINVFFNGVSLVKIVKDKVYLSNGVMFEKVFYKFA